MQVWKDKPLPSEPLKPWPLLSQHPHSLAHKHFAGLASSARVRPPVTRAKRKRWCRGRYAHAGTPRDSRGWGRDPLCLPHCLPCRLSGGRWKQWRRGSSEVGGRGGAAGRKRTGGWEWGGGISPDPLSYSWQTSYWSKKEVIFMRDPHPQIR